MFWNNFGFVRPEITEGIIRKLRDWGIGEPEIKKLVGVGKAYIKSLAMELNSFGRENSPGADFKTRALMFGAGDQWWKTAVLGAKALADLAGNHE